MTCGERWKVLSAGPRAPGEIPGPGGQEGITGTVAGFPNDVPLAAGLAAGRPVGCFRVAADDDGLFQDMLASCVICVGR